MDIRQLCNVSWVAQVEWLDEKEFAKFQKELVSDPAVPVSHGVGDLMAVMRQSNPGRR